MFYAAFVMFIAACFPPVKTPPPTPGLASLSPYELLPIITIENADKNDNALHRQAHEAFKHLCSLHSPDKNSALLEILCTFGVDPRMKREILLMLAQEGTLDSINKIMQFENWAEKISQAPPPFRFDYAKFSFNDELLLYGYYSVKREFTDASQQKWIVLDLIHFCKKILLQKSRKAIGFGRMKQAH